jgi:hypothetical protein
LLTRVEPSKLDETDDLDQHSSGMLVAAKTSLKQKLLML